MEKLGAVIGSISHPLRHILQRDLLAIVLADVFQHGVYCIVPFLHAFPATNRISPCQLSQYEIDISPVADDIFPGKVLFPLFQNFQNPFVYLFLF